MKIKLNPFIEQTIRKLFAEGKECYCAGLIIKMDGNYYMISNGGSLILHLEGHMPREDEPDSWYDSFKKEFE